MTRETKNARIDDVFLGIEDHGCVTIILGLDYGGSGQAFGNCVLHGQWLYVWVRELLTTLEVPWRGLGQNIIALKGMHVRVEADDQKVYRIGHLLKDKWFDPQETEKSKHYKPEREPA